MMKYYYREHLAGYKLVQSEGKDAWHSIHSGKDFDDFPTLAFLEAALPRLHFSVSRPAVLEIGCGTGPAACYLARRGFDVDGIDIVPVAIEMARKLALERSLDVHYEVRDICELPHAGKPYDMILDSFCLQAIVLDEDRTAVFSNVRARLKRDGYYLISTAMFDEKRYRRDDVIVDDATGTVYNRYGETGLIEARSGVVYIELGQTPEDYEGVVRIRDTWYLPNRRHLKAPALRKELETAGFRVTYQGGQYGENMICVPEEVTTGPAA